MTKTIDFEKEWKRHRRANIIYDKIVDILDGCDFEDAELAISKIRSNFFGIEEDIEKKGDISMEWKKCSNPRIDLPRDKPFLALWRGTVCIAEFDEDDNLFYICDYPCQYGSCKIHPDKEGKFTHYLELKRPDDY